MHEIFTGFGATTVTSDRCDVTCGDSPTKNIDFTIKVLETKPNEQESEIASYKLKSSDFVKRFKNESITFSKEEVGLLDNLSLIFELFIHNSKG